MVIDGIFLHRDELVEAWDYSIFLDVPFKLSVARMAARDGSAPDPAGPQRRSLRRGPADVPSSVPSLGAGHGCHR